MNEITKLVQRFFAPVPATAVICLEVRERRSALSYWDVEVEAIEGPKTGSHRGLLAVWILFVAFILAIILATTVESIRFRNGMRPAINQRPAIAVALLEVASQPEVSAPVQQWILTWEKPDGVAGGNPKLRSFSTNAVVQRDDSEVMEFTAEYQFEGKVEMTRFHWDKNKEFGWWSQEYPKPGGHSGKWNLPNKDDEGGFEGEISDQTDVPILLRLEKREKSE